nr:hypothetical protein [Tanacetum cinerariifolium]
AGGVLAGSIDFAEFGDPAASESVPAIFTTDPAAISPLPHVPLPDGNIAIGTKWILKNKRDATASRLDIMFAVSACSGHQ